MMTHTVRVVGCDARTPTGYSRLIKVRATKTMLIEQNGTRWQRSSGYMITSNRFPVYRLDLDTLTPIAA